MIFEKDERKLTEQFPDKKFNITVSGGIRKVELLEEETLATEEKALIKSELEKKGFQEKIENEK